ncbi:S8 family serine peptidase [Pseudoponticoccus marisrubri]|uniref:Peptidase S8/S53 domain-containing protein n=1 Tax=Pseudoponticoccus marisrubri TaxID=1685382 RepID=A0A0W7WJ59_9RHOB|nr:S8 family serine peptidase [Pseudoponticoccus marisrubri]KUF10652.1 hypothetical protein AVJ23_12330 [Pseudoponticoccus marisrubri]
MTRYIVLRDTAGAWRRPEIPLEAKCARIAPDALAAPVIDAHDFTPAELREAARAPNFLVVSPVIPTRIIGPEPLDELRADDGVAGWGIDAVGARPHGAGGAGAALALLDTGIDAGHPAFAGLRIEPRDFAGSGIEDANGHGTHLAGTALGRDVAGERIGVAPGVDRLVVGKAVSDTGRGDSQGFLQAMLFALARRVDVIGFALAFDIGRLVEDLVEADYPISLANAAAIHAYRGNLRIFETLLQMQDRPPLILGAVGNDCRRTISPEFETGPSSPAAARNVLSVGALAPGPQGLCPAPFSNCGPELVAPGVDVRSAEPGGGLRSMHSSSAAMAHALGVAGLWVAALRATGQPTDARHVAARLLASATRDGLAGAPSVIDVGQGLVQAPPVA